MHFSDLKIINNNISFKISNIDTCIVNSIRRIILSEIPNVAIYFDPYDMNRKDVIIHKNTGPLHNEFIGQRISLIPLWFTELEIINFKPEKYKFILKKHNKTMDIMNVTTGDFELYEDGKKIDSDKLFPKNPITNDYVLITKLKPNIYNEEKGDEIDIECRASVNIAKTHARWCPVSKCCYHNIIDEEKAEKALKEKLKDVDDETRIKIENKFNTLDKYRHYKTNKYDEPSEFQFDIESECRMKPNYLFYKAIQILINKIELLIKSKLSITNVRNIPNFYEIQIKNEDFTLLNVLQALIYNYNFRDNPNNNILEYIGYNQTHPLDNLMILKLKFNTDTDLTEFMIKNCTRIIEDLKQIAEKWAHISKLQNELI